GSRAGREACRRRRRPRSLRPLRTGSQSWAFLTINTTSRSGRWEPIEFIVGDESNSIARVNGGRREANPAADKCVSFDTTVCSPAQLSFAELPCVGKRWSAQPWRRFRLARLMPPSYTYFFHALGCASV